MADRVLNWMPNCTNIDISVGSFGRLRVNCCPVIDDIAQIDKPYTITLDRDTGTLTAGDQIFSAPEAREKDWCDIVESKISRLRVGHRMTQVEIKERAIDALGYRGRKRLNPAEQTQLRNWIRKNHRMDRIEHAFTPINEVKK